MFSQLFGRYCESSLSPAFAHIWVLCFEAASVTVAMYCLIQFYLQLKNDLAEHRPFLKVLCIKLVIFFSFWQNVCVHNPSYSTKPNSRLISILQLVISFLSSSSAPGGGVLKPSEKIAYPDIKVGIPSVLLAVEMSVFAIIHIFAFSAKPYDIRHNPDPTAAYSGGFMGWKAILDAFNLWDIVKASARGFRWLFVGARKREQDISYEEHRRVNGSEAVKLSEIQSEYSRPQYAPPEYDGALGASGVGRVGVVRKDNERPVPVRRETNDSDDRAALLSNPQSVPKINLREPNPYGDPSRDPSPYREEPINFQDGRGNGPFSDKQSGPGGPKQYDSARR
jgi:hypothetical protein